VAYMQDLCGAPTT